MPQDQPPPFTISNTDGTFKQTPVYHLELSGGVLTKLSPVKVQLAISGAIGPSGPSGATLVQAQSGDVFLTYGASTNLTAERIVAASDNITIVSSGTSFIISATTGDLSVKQDAITYPLGINS